MAVIQYDKGMGVGILSISRPLVYLSVEGGSKAVTYPLCDRNTESVAQKSQ
jgi:hypothetical protein